MVLFENKPTTFVELINAMIAPHKIKSQGDITEEQAVSIIVNTIESMLKIDGMMSETVVKLINLHAESATDEEAATALKYTLELSNEGDRVVMEFDRFVDAMFGKPE